MTFTQIRYFIEVARCLNFTEAAARLYVTQPTLSRQITAIESELNMQLFIRGNKSLRLTPGGSVLFEEFKSLMDTYEISIKKAREASFGMIGALNIGVIDGLNIGGILPPLISYLENHYPNIKIHLLRDSFQNLIKNIYDCTMDAVITFDFDVKSRPGLKFKNVRRLHPVLVIPKKHPLAVLENLTIKNMAEESLVIVNPEECPSGVALVTETCKEYGGFYPRFHFVDTMEDAILWVEAGVKCALLNDGMNIMDSDQVKIYYQNELPPMHAVLAWNPENTNFTLPLLIDWYKNYSQTV